MQKEIDYEREMRRKLELFINRHLINKELRFKSKKADMTNLPTGNVPHTT